MSNLSSPDSAIYIISPDQKARYDAQFRKFLPNGDFMSGEQAKGIMLQSGLPPMVLANVWSLADVDADGRMDINEFSIALHLIALKLKGIEVPRTLPSSLKVLVEPPPAFAAFNDQPSMNNNTPAGKPLVHSNSSISSSGISSSMSSATKMVGSSGNLAGQASGSPKMSISGAEWSIPQPSKLKYTQLFNSNDRSRLGFLTGPQARNILLETKVPQTRLAQVWNLADVDADGKLTCEEFVLAMHLIDKVRANEVLPAKLPPDLIPPSYRRGGTGTLSHNSSIDDPASDSGLSGDMLKNSFEDKRRENYEKGQAELDRRRAALAEQQKREREERERKEREEAARREKERLEIERRKQEELERQQALIREKELEKEEAKRRQSEVRELARREMERQRQREIEQTQRQELINVRSRLQEEVQKLKSRKKALKIEHEQAEKRISESKAQAQASRDKVVRVKADIDSMRTRRDAIMARQAATKAQMKALTDKQLFIEQEKVKLSAQLKTLFANASNGVGSADQMTSFGSMLQAKQLAINQLRAHLERYESEYKTKREDVRTGRQELDEMKRRFERKRQEAKSFADRIEAKRQEAERLREMGADAAAAAAGTNRAMANATTAAPAFVTSDVEVMSVPQFDWANSKKTTSFSDSMSASASGAKQPQTKFKYQCIYEFEARNKDEITIKPGDIIMVDTSAASEPEWLSGEVNGKVGWFPQGYAELIDENGDSAMAVVDNEPKPLDAAWGAASVDNSAEVDAATAAAETAAAAVAATSGGGADSSFTATASANTATLKTARALYDWTSTEQGHLNFTTGELIRITEYQDTWYYGELVNGSASGWFPESYVEIVSGGEAVAGASTDQNYYVGLYAFESQEKGDLEFGEGELVLVEKKEGEWWTGVILDRSTGRPNEARRGIFPSNFVGPATAADIPSSVAAASSTPKPAAAAAPAVKEAVVVATSASETKAHQRLDRKESDLSSAACESPKPKKGKAKAKEIVTAIASYTASGPEQLTLEVGQLIVVRKKMASGWWEGELTAKGKKKQVGWFPASYVKALAGVAGASSAGSSARSTPDPAAVGVKTAPAAAPAEEQEIERVVGLYSFNAEREDEISIDVGDTIRVLSKPDPTWWRGHNTRTGAIGLFPSNHVQSAAKAAEAAEQNNNYYTSNGYEHSADNQHHYYDHVQPDTDTTINGGYHEGASTSAIPVTDYSARTGDDQREEANNNSNYRYYDSFEDDDEDTVYSQQQTHQYDHVDGGYEQTQVDSSIPSVQLQSQNGKSSSSTEQPQAQYYSEEDDSFDDSDDEEEVNGKGDRSPATTNSHNSPSSLDLSRLNSNLNSNSNSLQRRSPQLYTVRIMDIDGRDVNQKGKHLSASQMNLSLNLNNGESDRATQHRLNIIYELLTTEEVYIKDIYFTLQNFRNPLLDSRLFATKEVQSYFSNLEQIYEVNYEFYTKLTERLQSEEEATESMGGSNNPRFCDILLISLKKMLPIYKRFCSAQMASSRQLQLKIESDVQFGEVLQSISRQCKAHLPLSSYLLKPMQRITKYPLLNEKLFEATPSGHPDYNDAEAAMKFSKSFCKEINEACRDTENFDKLIWLQKHINIPQKNLDYVIDFNSETNFLGPRTLHHSGILVKASSSKVLAAFLFNDFLLLAMPNKKFTKSVSSGHNFFYNQKALDLTYTLYKKPMLLHEFSLADLPEFESSLDPGLFRIYVHAQKRHLSLRANSTNECVLWMKQIDKAKRQYTEIQKRLASNSNEEGSSSNGSSPMNSILPNQAPTATLYLTIVEALQLYTRNYALNAYCKVSIGKDAASIHTTKKTTIVRLEIASSKGGTLSKKNKDYQKNGNSVNAKDGTFKITWNSNFKINLSSLLETLFISCYDENPYAPHHCIGEAAIPLDDIVQQRRYVQGTITKDVPLRIPNQNLLNNYHIKPSVLLKYDLIKFGTRES